MGKLVIMVPTPNGVENLLSRTEDKIEIRLYNYKSSSHTYNFKKCTDFTVENDGIHFQLFSDDIVIPFSKFDKINLDKPETHDYFK